MNYIYDILLNFHKEDFEFYDWNIDDDIIHIRKMPIIRISNDLLYKMVHFDFSVSLEFMKKISNRTEIFSHKSIKIIKNMCMFSDGKDVLAVKFSNNGKKEKTSRLLLDEKEEVLDVISSMEESQVEITLDREYKQKGFKTREEQKIYNYIQREIQKKDYDKLKYTYFECFNKEEIEIKKIIKRLKLALDEQWNVYYEKIYNILTLSSVKKSRN